MNAGRPDVASQVPVGGQPLAGLRVLVTRPEDQAEGLIQDLRDLGAEPVICPTIRIAPMEDLGPLDRAVAQVETYDWVIFTSVNGVHHFLARLDAVGAGPERLAGRRWAAIGPATARALAERGLQADLVPGKYVAEAILDEIGDVVGQRILLPRADIARRALAEGLRARGAQVDEVAAYRTIATGGRLPEEPVQIATFTSPSTLRSFVALLEGAGRSAADYLAGAQVACIGPITARAAADEGLRVGVVAEEHTVGGLLTAILAYVQEDRR